MSKELNVENILKYAKEKRQIAYELKRSTDKRNYFAKFNLDARTKLCPCCSGGLIWKTSGVDSVCFCADCGFFKCVKDQVFDECVEMNERYIPGITKTPKGYVEVRILNGKIVREEKSEKIPPLIYSPHA